MAIVITATLGQVKPEFTVATTVNPATGLIAAVPRGAVAVLVGSSVPLLRKVEILNRLQQCEQVLCEADYPPPGNGTLNRTAASVGIDGVKSSVVLNNAVTALAETDIAVVYGDQFWASETGEGLSQLFGGHITKLVERYHESQLKAA